MHGAKARQGRGTRLSTPPGVSLRRPSTILVSRKPLDLLRRRLDLLRRVISPLRKPAEAGPKSEALARLRKDQVRTELDVQRPLGALRFDAPPYFRQTPPTPSRARPPMQRAGRRQS
jgi:hypothetical protein